jgi:hypothetical protein
MTRWNWKTWGLVLALPVCFGFTAPSCTAIPDVGRWHLGNPATGEPDWKDSTDMVFRYDPWNELSTTCPGRSLTSDEVAYWASGLTWYWRSSLDDEAGYLEYLYAQAVADARYLPFYQQQVAYFLQQYFASGTPIAWHAASEIASPRLRMTGSSMYPWIETDRLGRHWWHFRWETYFYGGTAAFGGGQFLFGSLIAPACAGGCGSYAEFQAAIYIPGVGTCQHLWQGSLVVSYPNETDHTYFITPHDTVIGAD